MENTKSNNTKEKMLKSCKKLSKVITGFVWTLAGIIISYLLLLIILSIIVIVAPNVEMKEQVGNYLAEVIRFGESDRIEEKIEEINEIKNNNMLVQTVECVMAWAILRKIADILENIVKNQTPFTKENIGYMKRISIYATILWGLTTPFIINVGLIFVLAIWVMSYIFKYGYELQLESDETL